MRSTSPLEAPSTPGRIGRSGAVGLCVMTFCFGLLATPVASAEVKLRPGKYAVTISYEVQDQRQNELRTGTRCITLGDLSHPERIFDDNLTSPHPTPDSCSVRSWKAAHGRFSYVADCANRKVRVEGAIGATEFSVVRKVWLKAGRKAALKLMLRGKWMGDCPAEAKGRRP